MLNQSDRERAIIAEAAKRYAARYGDDAADYARRCAAAMLVAGNIGTAGGSGRKQFAPSKSSAAGSGTRRAGELAYRGTPESLPYGPLADRVHVLALAPVARQHQFVGCPGSSRAGHSRPLRTASWCPGDRRTRAHTASIAVRPTMRTWFAIGQLIGRTNRAACRVCPGRKPNSQLRCELHASCQVPITHRQREPVALPLPGRLRVRPCAPRAQLSHQT